MDDELEELEELDDDMKYSGPWRSYSKKSSYLHISHSHDSAPTQSNVRRTRLVEVVGSQSDNLGASPSTWKFASFIFSMDDRPGIDASQRQFVKMTLVSVIEKLTVNP